ncbi:DUF2798 domain-containing protein [Halorubrum aethiopicum]|uniref:DUF2798 domain-containing protein n=1 Tax=Halorubrum aethiopicum TaxID=1758255 RepID=UPI00082F0DF4|nr:DUF2798 domain-containing protein [Halorubrum aethiopicum]
MAFFMSLTIALALRVLLDGIGPGFVGAWLQTATIAFIVAWPAAVVFFPVVNTIVDRLFLLATGESQQAIGSKSKTE